MPTITGLDFPGNSTAGSDIRLLWTGANLLPRYPHTAIWKAYYKAQSNYYALKWHTPNAGSFDGGNWSLGMHPYPTDGLGGNWNPVTGQGFPTNSTDHLYEIAIGGSDIISTPDPGGSGNQKFTVTKGVWVTQAGSVELVSGTTLRHRFYPDLGTYPNGYIEYDWALSNLSSSNPGGEAFLFGASDWRSGIPSAGQNDETPNCYLRWIKLFDDVLSNADILSEAAYASEGATTTAGIAALWYSNLNPTPTDVTDKSGAGHDPSWANANRPSLFSETTGGAALAAHHYRRRRA